MERMVMRRLEMQRVEALEAHVAERIGVRHHEMQRVGALEAHVVESIGMRSQEMQMLQRNVLADVGAKFLEVQNALESKTDAGGSLAELVAQLSCGQQETQAKLQALEEDVIAMKVSADPAETAMAAPPANGLAFALTQLDDLCSQIARQVDENKDGEVELRQQLAEVARQAKHAEDGVGELKLAIDLRTAEKVTRQAKRSGDASHWSEGTIDFAPSTFASGFSYSSKTQRLAPLKGQQVSSGAVPFASRCPSSPGRLAGQASCPNLLLPPVVR